MDLYRIINELLEERNRVNRIIESLESMEEDGTGLEPVKKRRRGRKRMDASARKNVSIRMKQYWAKRRASAQGEK
jgi:hypothetical protein